MKEKVSALLDGALDEVASARMLDSLKRDGALRKEWDSYCLIGDALREEAPLSSDFTSKVMLSLQDEPVVLAPVSREGSRGWITHLMPIAASVMGVAAVGWVAMVLNGNSQGPVQIAGAPKAPVSVAAAAPVLKSGVVPVNAEVSDREYLFAHQSLAPSPGMPGVAHYVRTVSDTAPAGK
ncbi:sigma-E factor negative regulatory protein [Zoogloea sp.]|uniref:sigma-E factor negative regulatory protein n=1 Tax=Zoogloea sp. TaxID=49181 RepID=UPI00260A98F0|nr:sigma-E factor negative regulatory protein [Zoogloea sp.]MDD3354114.1 sigma-E factor negative regulatory protein [Zoogloea sp.]